MSVFLCLHPTRYKVACSVGEGLLDGIVASEADAVGGHPDKEVRAALRPQARRMFL